MAVVKEKYRGSTTYYVVLCELITAARYQGLVTYQQIAQVMGLPSVGSHMGKEVGQILGEVSEDEHNQDRPMLSALAIGVSGKPGKGFFQLAVEFGKLNKPTFYGTAKDQEERDKWEKEVLPRFWEVEKQEVYDAWRGDWQADYRSEDEDDE